MSVACARAAGRWNRLSAPRREEAALALVEIMLAIVLVAFGLLKLTQIYNDGISTAVFARQVTQATALGERQLAEVSARGFSYAQSLVDHPLSPQPAADQEGAGGAAYSWWVQAKQWDPRLVQVTVTVQWPGKGQRDHSLSFATLLAHR